MLSLWTALLRIEPGLVVGILQSLDLLDSLSIMVYALELDDQAAMSVMRDHSPLFPFDEVQIMRFAVVHGCFHAVYALRKTRHGMYGDRPTRRAEKALDGVTSHRKQLMQWLGAPQTYHYRFPDEGVMYEAAMIGDLDVIKWIHSGTTAYTPFLAVEHAARAGHLACAQWLAEKAQENTRNYVLSVQVVVTVPFDAELGIFAWYASNAEHLRPPEFQRTTPRPIHRSGLAFQGAHKKTIVALKTAPSWQELEKLTDPVTLAAEEGNIKLLEVLKRSKSKYQWAFTQTALVQAVAQGQLVALQWLLDNEVVPDEDIAVAELVTIAMNFGQMEILRWLDASFAIDQVPYEFVRSAAISGRLAVVKWVCERFPSLPANQDLLSPSWQYSGVGVAMWLHKNKSLLLNPLMPAAFINHGDVALLKAFLKCNADSGGELVITPFLFEQAYGHSSLEMVQYLAEHHGVWSEKGMNAAVSSSNFPVIKWLFSTGRPCASLLFAARCLAAKGETALATSFAARIPKIGQQARLWPIHASTGYREVACYPHFIYGHQEKSEEAAKNLLIDVGYPKIFSIGNLWSILANSRDADLVQLFLTRRPELLDYHVFQWTAKFRHVKLLGFLFALAKTHREAMKVYKRGVYVVLMTACELGHLGVLKWVRQHAMSPSTWIVHPRKSVQYGQAHLLKWLHESGMLDEKKLAGAMPVAVTFAHLDVLRWYEATYELEYVFSLQELQYAVQQRHADVVAWIVRKQPELTADQELSHEIELLLQQWEVVAKYLKQQTNFST